MNTGRMEAFSDGVIAVAITLLVLDLKVPAPVVPHLRHTLAGYPTLAHDLLHQWPSYLAFVTSFLTIGIIWINHHSMITRLKQGDHVILVLNLLLLMSISVLPFTTSLMASYLRESHGENLAAGVYASSLLVMAVLFSALNFNILIRKGSLLSEELTLEQRRLIYRRAIFGVLPYVVAVAAAPVSAYATIAICTAIAVYYALPIASGR